MLWLFLRRSFGGSMYVNSSKATNSKREAIIIKINWNICSFIFLLLRKFFLSLIFFRFNTHHLLRYQPPFNRRRVAAFILRVIQFLFRLFQTYTQKMKSAGFCCFVFVKGRWRYARRIRIAHVPLTAPLATFWFHEFLCVFLFHHRQFQSKIGLKKRHFSFQYFQFFYEYMP